MGETRVDLLHLLEDLRDAYPGSIEDTIASEIVANALDSGARTIAFTADPAARTLTVTDDGSGMSRAELRRYHDLAASAKTRGKGIGFAGVGIKLGLLACDEVITETRRGKSHVATRWHLASRHRAPWQWTPPPGLVTDRGTAVRLAVTNPLSPLLDPGFLTVTVRRHFAPLLDPWFAAVLARWYPAGVKFLVNGAAVTAEASSGERAPLAVRVGRQRKPSAVGYLVRSDEPIPEDRRGVAVSTLGKVIRRGWDWLGLAPATAERVTGLIEAPALAAALTLTKGDFLRAGRPGMLYLAYRKALQEAVGAQLAAWGDARAAAGGGDARRAKRRSLERVLRGVLAELADDYPLLSSLVDWGRGGQRRLPIGGRGGRPGEGVGAGVPGVPGLATEGSPFRAPGVSEAAPEREKSGEQAPPSPRRRAQRSRPVVVPSGRRTRGSWWTSRSGRRTGRSAGWSRARCGSTRRIRRTAAPRRRAPRSITSR